MTHSPAWPFSRITANSPTVRSATDRQTLASRGQVPSRPACVRIRGVRCCAGSAATTSAWLTSSVASAKRSVGIAARSAIRGRRWPVREARMSLDCLVTHRLSGPCTLCRQPAWPAHVRGLLIYCEACCGCGQGGAEAAGTDAAPGGARSGLACRMPLARATGVAIPLERGGKAPDTTPPLPRPSRAVSGLPRGFLRAAPPRLAGGHASPPERMLGPACRGWFRAQTWRRLARGGHGRTRRAARIGGGHAAAS